MVAGSNPAQPTIFLELMPFIVIARDGKDKEALDRRLKVREDHIRMGDRLKAEGKALYGAALLSDEGQMNGSVYIVDFASRKELDEWLKIEPYVVGEVWKNIEVIPCQIGPSFID